MKNTPHIQPNEKEIAKTVLLPGDPLRAKFIADNYLEDVIQFNAVRNMLGYTGTYKGKRISVMGTGMGAPSMGIYSWELIHVFGVQNLIRIGSCGAIQEELELYDIIVAMGASTNSNYAAQYNLPGSISALGSWKLLQKTQEVANQKNIHLHVGNVLSSDVFYSADTTAMDKWKAAGILGVEMEAIALYLNAMHAKVNALCILTVSDHIYTGKETTATERERAFTKMMEMALEVANEI